MSIDSPASGPGAERKPEVRRPRPRPLASPTTGRISPSAAAITRPLLIVLPILALLVPGLFIAFARQPVHSAEARVLVGTFDASSQASSAVEASQSLAATYSRLISSDVIVRQTAEALGVQPGTIRGHIGGSPIPDSAIIRVEADADSRAEAIRRADAAAEALVVYSTSGGADPDEVLERYAVALQDLRAGEAEVARLSDAVDTAQASGDTAAAAAAREALTAAEVAVEGSRLRSTSLAERFARTQGGGLGTTQLIGGAVDTGNDRRSAVQLAVGAAVVLGGIIGIALATVVVNREYASDRFGAPARP